MPIYEYECKECGHKFETIRKISAGPPDACPACGKDKLQKLVSKAAFRLKGTGWYETDFKNKPVDKKADDKKADDKKSNDKKSDGGSSSGDADSKSSKSDAKKDDKSSSSSKEAKPATTKTTKSDD